MPFVTIMMIEGRPAEAKRALIREVTDAVQHSLQVSRESIRVILQELPAANWGVAGEPKKP